MAMTRVILDDYLDCVRHLGCSARWQAHEEIRPTADQLTMYSAHHVAHCASGTPGPQVVQELVSHSHFVAIGVPG